MRPPRPTAIRKRCWCRQSAPPRWPGARPPRAWPEARDDASWPPHTCIVARRSAGGSAADVSARRRAGRVWSPTRPSRSSWTASSARREDRPGGDEGTVLRDAAQGEPADGRAWRRARGPSVTPGDRRTRRPGHGVRCSEVAARPAPRSTRSSTRSTSRLTLTEPTVPPPSSPKRREKDTRASGLRQTSPRADTPGPESLARSRPEEALMHSYRMLDRRGMGRGPLRAHVRRREPGHRRAARHRARMPGPRTWTGR